MSGAPKRDAGGAPPPARKTEEATVQKSDYVVARRRTVNVEGKPLGPGSPIDLPSDEIKHLLKAGFVVLAADQQQLGGGVGVGGLQIRGGRKSGGKIVK